MLLGVPVGLLCEPFLIPGLSGEGVGEGWLISRGIRCLAVKRICGIGCRNGQEVCNSCSGALVRQGAVAGLLRFHIERMEGRRV
jgi:hypothetical protein